MRILGFSRKWSKLNQDKFTTFRYPRKDSYRGMDWHGGEDVQIVYRPRHEHEVLGVAKIISKETKQCQMITDIEAIADGFQEVGEMMDFLGLPVGYEWINKLTLRWIERQACV